MPFENEHWANLTVGLLLLSLVLSGLPARTDCGGSEVRKMPSESDYQIPEGCDFSSIGHKYASNECSPVFLNRQLTGLLINAPASISLNEGEFKIQVACAYRHRPAEPLNIGKNIRNSIIFVAVDQRTDQTYTAKVRDIENRKPDRKKKPRVDSAKLEKKIVGGWVNIELIEAMGLPAEVADYVLYATVDKYKSNLVTVRVTK